MERKGKKMDANKCKKRQLIKWHINKVEYGNNENHKNIQREIGWEKKRRNHIKAYELKAEGYGQTYMGKTGRIIVPEQGTNIR